MSLKPMGFLAVVATIGLGAAAAAHSQTLPDVSALSVDEIVELRVSTMRSNGRTLRGANALSGPEAVAVGDRIVENARLMKLLFPEGSNSGGSNAFEGIWADWDNFIALIDKLEADAMAVASAARTGDQQAYVEALRTLGGNCGTCHETYRVEMN